MDLGDLLIAYSDRFGEGAPISNFRGTRTELARLLEGAIRSDRALTPADVAKACGFKRKTPPAGSVH